MHSNVGQWDWVVITGYDSVFSVCTIGLHIEWPHCSGKFCSVRRWFYGPRRCSRNASPGSPMHIQELLSVSLYKVFLVETSSKISLWRFKLASWRRKNSKLFVAWLGCFVSKCRINFEGFIYLALRVFIPLQYASSWMLTATSQINNLFKTRITYLWHVGRLWL